jgi:hypothetical protein
LNATLVLGRNARMTPNNSSTRQRLSEASRRIAA